MRTDERNHYRQPDRLYDVLKSQSDTYPKTGRTKMHIFSMLLALVLYIL